MSTSKRLLGEYAVVVNTDSKPLFFGPFNRNLPPGVPVPVRWDDSSRETLELRQTLARLVDSGRVLVRFVTGEQSVGEGYRLDTSVADPGVQVLYHVPSPHYGLWVFVDQVWRLTPSTPNTLGLNIAKFIYSSETPEFNWLTARSWVAVFDDHGPNDVTRREQLYNSYLLNSKFAVAVNAHNSTGFTVGRYLHRVDCPSGGFDNTPGSSPRLFFREVNNVSGPTGEKTINGGDLLDDSLAFAALPGTYHPMRVFFRWENIPAIPVDYRLRVVAAFHVVFDAKNELNSTSGPLS